MSNALPIITLERTVCFGFCPVYRLEIYSDGRIEYEGVADVNVVGKVSDTIELSSISRILDVANEIGYFKLEDVYDAMVSDVPTTHTSVTIDGQTKRIKNRFGGPKRLYDFEFLIDRLADSRQWTGVKHEDWSEP